MKSARLASGKEKRSMVFSAKQERSARSAFGGLALGKEERSALALNFSAPFVADEGFLEARFYRVLSQLAVFGKWTWQLELTAEQVVCAERQRFRGRLGELFSAAQEVRFRQVLTEGAWGAFSEVLTEGLVEMIECLRWGANRALS